MHCIHKSCRDNQCMGKNLEQQSLKDGSQGLGWEHITKKSYVPKIPMPQPRYMDIRNRNGHCKKMVYEFWMLELQDTIIKIPGI